MEQTNNGNLLEIIDLAHSLRQEHLFINNEQSTFIKLTEKLKEKATNVAQLAWICSQQRQNLSSLIIARPDTGPSVCCQRANKLENTRFVESYKAKGLKYEHVIAYNELFNYLHHSPYLLAQSLSIGDRLGRMSSDQMNSVIRTIATGLYGNVILSKDVDMVLRLLRDLIEIQIIVSDNPRRMLRNGSCAFSRLYHRLHEGLFSAKLFLTAALHEPVMKILISDEVMLDIDSTKAVRNYSQRERLKKFGPEGTNEYAEKFREFRQETINSLDRFSKLFIKSLADNWALFPSTLRWVVQTMCHLLKTVHVSDKDLNDILTDMVFTNFICPAIVSPDLYGISDAPISENARFNLIQVGQILQMLALMKHEDIDPKFMILFELFDRNIVSELMDQLLDTEYDIRVSTIAIPHQNDFGRAHVLVTQTELNIFVDFLRGVLVNDELAISGEDRRKLGKILDQLPDKWETIVNGDRNNITLMPENQSKTKQLINLGKNTKNKLAKSISMNAASHNEANDMPTNNGCNGLLDLNNAVNGSNESEEVLLVPIMINEENKFQLLTEEDVMKMNNMSNKIEPALIEPDAEIDKVNDDAFEELADVLPIRKHTRFSISQDDQSIGNTSDNLEAVSEAPSNLSVTSSLELEENDQNLNDNLSDMVSANVSGRGTPNISGRDTPSSQVTEGDIPQIPTPQMAKILSKARSDIDDKFCKFEIKKLVERDETVSIISDTWSTDVLASDSETLEPSENERNFSTPLIPSAVVLPGDNNFNPLATSISQVRANYLDASDTRSESAWSTDVLASDSEKLNEVDTDDNQSIAAKSDITDAGRSEGDPIPDLIPTNQRAPDSPYFAARNPSVNVRAPDSPMFTPRTPGSPLFSNSNSNTNRSNTNSEQAAGSYSNDDFPKYSNAIPTISSGRTINGRFIENPMNYRNYRSVSSGMNPSGSSYDREAFLTTVNASMRRQNSAESSISNQSSNMDESPAMSINKNKKGKDTTDRGKNEYLNNDGIRKSGRRVQKEEVIVKTSTDIINPFADEEQSNQSAELRFATQLNESAELTEDNVERRRVSSEQRNAIYDGRRNGIMSLSAISTSTTTITTKRFASSLNYENHEIIAQRLIQPLETSATDDDKNKQQDEFLLVQTALALNLNDESSTNTANPDSAILYSSDSNGSVTAASTSNSSKPPKYTGAIPKSISFDSSADKNGDRSYNRRSDPLNQRHHHHNHNNNHHHHHNSNSRHNGTGFFNKIKQGFKNRRSNKLPRGIHDDLSILSLTQSIKQNSHENGATVSSSAFLDRPQTATENGFAETTDDILAKYRRKISSSSEATNSDSVGNNSNNRKSSSNSDEQRLSSIVLDENVYFYRNAKQKLRLVLSTTDLHTADFRHTNCNKTPPLLTYLQIQLAQALNLQHLQQISYVSEAIRCVNLLDGIQQQTLITDLQSDLIKRQSYLQYLMRYRQNLLSALENIDRFDDRLRNDREMCNRHLILVCVRMFLEKREQNVEQFQDEFVGLTVVDEKIDFMNEFMERLMNELKSDGVLGCMAGWQLEEARICIERILLQRLYRHVMFPNDDADLSRDEVLHQHIRKLSKLITPSHKALRIPKEFLIEAPWPFAQQQISYISAYKTPREKVLCVVRCITSIMNLLQMSVNCVPSADDLIPVLIYVVIKANPPYLLSTIQYVNAFIGDQIVGEDQYWWTQFCSAVTFIKTMDYSD